MSLEEQIKDIVESTVKRVLVDFINELKPKPEDDIFITPKEAGKMLNCSDDVIKQLQDAGQLTLCFKPSIPKDGKGENQNRHRLVLKAEVREMAKKLIAKSARKK